MATEKHKTVLEIAVEDRLLRRFGDTLKRVFSTEPIERHHRAQQKVTQEIEKQARAADKASGAPGKRPVGRAPGAQRDPRTGQYVPGSGRQGAGGGQGGGGGGRQPLGFGGTALATGVGFVGGQAVSRGAAGMAGMARGQGATAGALGAIPIAGGFLQAAFQGAESLAAKSIAQGQAQAQTAGQTGLGNVGGMGMEKFGISRMQMPAKLAQLAQQSGMRGKDLAALGPGALRTEALTGISGGAMAGAAGTAGGQVSPESAQKMTMEAISAGMDAGFRDAKLGTFIQQIAGDIGQMRSKGIMVDPQALPAITRMLGKTGGKGLQGEAGLHAAKTMAEGMKGAGQRNDFYGALAMQTAMDQGMSAYEAELALEGDAETLKKYGLTQEKLTQMTLESMGSMGGSTEAKAKALRKWMPGLSARQALDMATSAEKKGFDSDMPEDAAARGLGYESEQEAAEKAGFQSARGEAELENLQIGEGKKIEGKVQAVHRRDVQTGAMVGADIGAKGADIMSGQIQKYAQAFQSGGMGGVLGVVGDDMKALFTGLTEQLSEAVKKAFGMDMGEAGDELARATPEEISGALNLIREDVQKFFAEIWAFLKSHWPSWLGGGGGDDSSKPATLKLRPGGG